MKKKKRIPLIVWKHAPKSICIFLNKVFGRPILARSRLVAQWSRETKSELRRLHGMNMEQEVQSILAKELKESLR